MSITDQLKTDLAHLTQSEDGTFWYNSAVQGASAVLEANPAVRTMAEFIPAYHAWEAVQPRETREVLSTLTTWVARQEGLLVAQGVDSSKQPADNHSHSMPASVPASTDHAEGSSPSEPPAPGKEAMPRPKKTIKATPAKRGRPPKAGKAAKAIPAKAIPAKRRGRPPKTGKAAPAKKQRGSAGRPAAQPGLSASLAQAYLAVERAEAVLADQLAVKLAGLTGPKREAAAAILAAY